MFATCLLGFFLKTQDNSDVKGERLCKSLVLWSLRPLSREQSRLKMQVSNALVENATLERVPGNGQMSQNSVWMQWPWLIAWVFGVQGLQVAKQLRREDYGKLSMNFSRSYDKKWKRPLDPFGTCPLCSKIHIVCRQWSKRVLLGNRSEMRSRRCARNNICQKMDRKRMEAPNWLGKALSWHDWDWSTLTAESYNQNPSCSKSIRFKMLDSWTPGPVSGGHLKELPEAAANEGRKTFWSRASLEVRSVWHACFRVKWGRGCPNAGPFLEIGMIEPIHRR